MIALSLVVYLSITLLMVLPFVLRYLVVTRNERHHEGKNGFAAMAAPRLPNSGHPLF